MKPKVTQSALSRYRQRRGMPALPAAPRRHRVFASVLLLAIAAAALSGVLWWRIQGPEETPATVAMTYELDLTDAVRGDLGVTLVMSGDLPGDLELTFAPSALAGPGAVRLLGLEAWTLNEDGSQGLALETAETPGGWSVKAGGATRVGLDYRLRVRGTPRSQQDVRRHISAPLHGGVRAAGYEVFLQPVGITPRTLTLAIHNPAGTPLLAPWPAQASGNHPHRQPEMVAENSIGQAHIASGLGYRPADVQPLAGGSGQAAVTGPLRPASLLFHPRGLQDLNNALLACGDLRTRRADVRGTSIGLGTDRDWIFDLDEARDLIARIARTEIAFFGSAPTDHITALLGANVIHADGGFDAYGLHIGSSLLVLLDPGTTAEGLRENAASVIAHEMFHGWLGEAIPQTDPATLWFTEGVTTWYAARMLTVAGIWNSDHATEVLGGRLRRDYAGSPFLGRMPVAAAAGEVMADPDQVRYAYAGAVAVCMALDRHLARRSGMMQPLDEVLRVLYREHRDRPLTRDNLVAVIHQVTGVDCTAWLDEHAYGTAALPPVEELI